MNQVTDSIATPSSTSYPPAVLSVTPVRSQPGVSLVSLSVTSLRRAILAVGPDVFMGSEDQLTEALGVSRPTFRQATKLLLQDGLLVIKRGAGGGFFSQAPSPKAVTRVATIYLNALGTSIKHVMDAVAPLQTAAAKALSTHPDPTVRRCLIDFLAQCHTRHLTARAMDPLLQAMRFEKLLSDRCGNPAIAMVIDAMRGLIREERRLHFLLQPDRIACHENFQVRLAQAVLDGDPEMATIICERYFNESRAWVPDVRLDAFTQ